MSFIKKSFSLNAHKPYGKIIDNIQLMHIQEYNNIIAFANQQAQNIIAEAQIEANNIIEHANQQAEQILEITTTKTNHQIQEAKLNVQNMLSEANDQVKDILINSEHRATQEVWEQAKQLIEALQHINNQFYTNTEGLIQGILATIIKKLTSNLELQDKMQVLVNQIFNKAKDVEYATLFFNPNDYENCPEFHIPSTWKIEKDNMLESGEVRLVGAGGEWKTSIKLIEDKMLAAVNHDEKHSIIPYNSEDDIEGIENIINDNIETSKNNLNDIENINNLEYNTNILPKEIIEEKPKKIRKTRKSAVKAVNDAENATNSVKE